MHFLGKLFEIVQTDSKTAGFERWNFLLQFTESYVSMFLNIQYCISSEGIKVHDISVLLVYPDVTLVFKQNPSFKTK